MTAFTNPAMGSSEPMSAGPPAGGSSHGPGPGATPNAPGQAESPYGWGEAPYRYAPSRGRLYRSTTDRVWAGVCGGLAEHFGWDPSVTRVGYAILALFTGIFPMLVLYIVMAMVIPNGPGTRASAAYADQREGGYSSARPRGAGSGAIVLGVLLIIGGGIALLDRYVLVDWRLFGPFILVGFGALLIALSLARRP